MRRAYSIYRYKLQKGDNDATARIIISSEESDETRDIPIPFHKMPYYYAKSLSNTINQKDVPIWDITFIELQKAYNKARFDPYLKYNATELIKKCFREFGISFKRRIPWLYPDNGKLLISNQHIDVKRYFNIMLSNIYLRLRVSGPSFWNKDY